MVWTTSLRHSGEFQESTFISGYRLNIIILSGRFSSVMVSHYTATLIEAAVMSAGVSSLRDVHIGYYTTSNSLFRVL
jgi:hypothetical protein